MLIKYKESLYSHEDVKFSDKGTKVVPTYILDFPDRGGVCLRKTGEKPIYEMIQANLVNCDLQNVIESCVHSNQYAVCTQDNLNTLIADFTGVSNLAYLYAGTKRMENTWRDLPLEVRESFDSDIKKFIRSIGTSEFDEKVSLGYEKFNENIYKNMSTKIALPIETPPIETPPKETEVKSEVK